MNFKLIWVDILLISLIYQVIDLDPKYVNSILFKGKDELIHYAFIFSYITLLLIKYFIQKSTGGATMAFFSVVNIIIGYIDFYKFYDQRVSFIPLSCYIIQVLFYIFSDPKSHLIKGPKLPEKDKVFGHLLQIKKAGSLHNFLNEQHIEFGKVFKFKWGKLTFVSICDQEMIYYNLQDQYDKPNSVLYPYLMPIVGSKSILYQNGKVTKTQRKNVLNPKILEKFTSNSLFKNMSDILQSEIQKVTNNVQNKQQIIIQDLNFQIVLKTMIVYVFGKQVYEQNQIPEDFYDSYKYVWNYVRESSLKYLPEQMTQEQEQELKNARKILRCYIQTLYDDSKSKQQCEGIVNLFLKNQKIYDEETIISDILTIILEGTEKTTQTLNWAIFYLCQNSDKQRKLQRELDDVYLEVAEGFTFKTFHQVLQKLKYPNLIIVETIRKCFLIPYITRINSNKEILLESGQIVQKDEGIVIPLAYLHINPEIWGKDVDQFLPERFQQKITYNCQFLPFGLYSFKDLGQSKNNTNIRGCPGIDVSQTIGISVLIAIFKKFNVSLQNPDQKQNLKQDLRVISQPNQQIKCQFQQRKS